MATKYVTFTGPVRWAKVWDGQCDRAYQTDKTGGNWSIIVTLDAAQVKLYNALGLKNNATSEMDVQIDRMKKSAQGKDSHLEVGDVTFRRNERHPKLGDLGNPVVVGVDDGTAIGNGSVCEVTVEVYPYTFEGKTGQAARLKAVKVVDLVPYVKPDTPPRATDVELPPVH